MSSEVSLIASEAYARDVGRGIVRIDFGSMHSLGITTGDVVEIKGKKRTVAKVLPLYPSDEKNGIIRVDGLVRNNGGADFGDIVTLKKLEVVAAEKVVVSFVKETPTIDPRYLADALESISMIRGDYVMVPFFPPIFMLTFRISEIKPADVVIVVKTTIFEILKIHNKEEYKETLPENLEAVIKTVKDMHEKYSKN